MKRLLLILLLIPSIAFGTYTEYYCQSGGSNLNAGSTNNNTATYSSIHGNWTNATGVFTPTDGSTPASTVSVGMWASVYIDGASVGVYVGRIGTVAAGVNGAITANTLGAGAKPANQTGTATIVVGGAWQGPNAASGFPFTLVSFGLNRDATAHAVRVNLKNDQTYSITSSITPSTASNASYVVEGYTGSAGDGGRATFDGGTSTGTVLANAGPTGTAWQDVIFKTSITSGSTNLVNGSGQTFIRCVFTGARNGGLVLTGSTPSHVIECEAYGNNTANAALVGAFVTSGSGNTFVRCISHDNTGSNTQGFAVQQGGVVIANCVADTNGANGILFSAASINGNLSILNSDFYNNTGDAINIASGSVPNSIWIENCNFIKNTGAGINNVPVNNWGFVFNCGYGSGTQANGADTINNLMQSGTITYASGATPWVDPANGDFTNNLPASQGTGRGAFTETASSYAGTVGYPDISAAAANVGVAFPTPTPTVTPTATPTATPTPIETSYAFPN
jgi:hypothetical protein